ncbi:MAG: hypothetical protein ACLS6G_05955 [Christensenellales bacterium]
MKTMPSLLAPAGNMRALQTALRFGADAVYCGAKQYGLRAQATISTKNSSKRLCGWRMRRARR